MGVILW